MKWGGVGSLGFGARPKGEFWFPHFWEVTLENLLYFIKYVSSTKIESINTYHSGLSQINRMQCRTHYGPRTHLAVLLSWLNQQSPCCLTWK